MPALSALGKIEFENTRNLGQGRRYSHLPVPGGGLMFSSFDFNHSYEETDVLVSLAKLKNHLTAGVTLSMKNLFGLPPNTLYGVQAGSEDATMHRAPMHDPKGFEKIKMPGSEGEGVSATGPGGCRVSPWMCASPGRSPGRHRRHHRHERRRGSLGGRSS